MNTMEWAFKEPNILIGKKIMENCTLNVSTNATRIHCWLTVYSYALASSCPAFPACTRPPYPAPPVTVATKYSRLEKKYYNAAVAKRRTQARGKQRDKRAVL